MTRLLWIGTADAAPDVLRAGHELAAFGSAEEALAALPDLPVEVAIIAAVDAYAPEAIRALKAVRPELQVLVAVHDAVPPAVSAVLRAGAAGFIDLSADEQSVSSTVRDAWIAHERESGERELLLRLRDLNEEFLRNIIDLEKRNLELAGRLEETARMAAGTLGFDLDSPGIKERVLVVDDEETICDLVGLALGEKYEVTSVLDGASACEKVATSAFHLVITDKNLPLKNGLEVMRAARAANADTDVILMTGYASTESAIEALNLGASAYLEKPFDLVTLVSRVDEVINRQRDRLKKRALLASIKLRNQEFLTRYGAIRTDLESWLAIRGVSLAGPTRKTGG